jgi:hypothetical protein
LFPQEKKSINDGKFANQPTNQPSMHVYRNTFSDSASCCQIIYNILKIYDFGTKKEIFFFENFEKKII